MELKPGMFYKISGWDVLKDGTVLEHIESNRKYNYFWDKGGRRVEIFKFNCIAYSLPTELEDAYVGAEITGDGYNFTILSVNNKGVTAISDVDNYEKVVFYAFSHLKKGHYKLVPQIIEPTEPEDERKARELLEERGRIKDGKVLK